MKKNNVNKTVKKITKSINRSARKNPTGTIAAGVAIATTSAIGTGTVVRGLIRLPGMIKRRFSKADLGDNNQNNNNDNSNQGNTNNNQNNNNQNDDSNK